MDFFLKEHKNSLSIKIVEENELVQRKLCKSALFEPFKNDNWDLDQESLILQVNNEEIKVVFDTIFETYLVFKSESLRELVFQSLQNLETLDNEWQVASLNILEKLNADNIIIIKEGIQELAHWVNDYNSQYVDHSMNSADLSLFGYDEDNWEEGNLWPNPLFDSILENYKEELNTQDLLHLIQALFNKNEDYSDCEATHTAIMFLLEKRTPEIELSIIATIINALEGHEPGHRYFEQSLLDRLVDNILPTFSTVAIIELLSNLHFDNLYHHHIGGCGDNFISLAHVALKRENEPKQKDILVNLIEKYK